MQLQFTADTGRPKLAWFASVDGSAVDVTHGNAVETHEQFLADGLWVGEFSAESFEQSFLAGTGGFLGSDSVNFGASSAPLDRRFFARSGSSVLVSNSLPCIFELGYLPGQVGNFVDQKLDAVNFRLGRRLHHWGIRDLVHRRLMIRLASRYKVHDDYTYLLAHWGTAVLREQYRGPCGPGMGSTA